MRYELLKNGNIVDTIVADADFMSANYTYGTYRLAEEYSAPAPSPSVWEWYIDKGPFFDRFKEIKMPVLLSQDPGIKALLADINNRHWIDLKREDVSQALLYIKSVLPILTSDKLLEILTTPVTAEENLALRKLYFSGQ